jgi:hypothetical protein
LLIIYPKSPISFVFFFIHATKPLGFNENLKVKKWARIIFSLFLIIHAGLHKALENHPLYTFNSLISKCLIFGAGLIGLMYLITLIGERFTYSPKTETQNSAN